MPEKKYRFLRGRKFEYGAAMLETLLALFVIFLVLLGMLQVFYYMAGQIFTEYSAFRGARSRSVGFNDYLAAREARINAIGASGELISPTLSGSFGGSGYSFGESRFLREKTLIERYVLGVTWLEYENWYGNQFKDGTSFSVHFSDRSGMTSATSLFQNYAFQEPYTKNLFFERGTNLKGTASMSENVSAYLEY